jgi:hypothetical protein
MRKAGLIIFPIILFVLPGSNISLTHHPGNCGISIGVNTDKNLDSPAWKAAIDSLGVDALHFHFSLENVKDGEDPVERNLEVIRDMKKFCQEKGLRFTLNNETANWGGSAYNRETGYPADRGKFPPKKGFEYTQDWFYHEDGTYRFDIPEAILGELSDASFTGVVYDEATHMQIGWNPYIWRFNEDPEAANPGYWAETDDCETIEEAYEKVLASCQRVREYYSGHGKKLITEHVWPVLFHTYARAGIIACTKFLKEEWTPVVGAIALGAAKQYGTEFWISPDLWYMGDFGLHPPEEYRSSLRYAYWLGAGTIYTEILKFGKRGLVNDDFQLSPHGLVLREFTTEYVPNHPRDHTHLDFQPEIVIIRFPDSSQGKGQSFIPNTLYGSKNLQTTPETEAWFAIWKHLTHGYLNDEEITWLGGSYGLGHYGGFPEHHFFCPLNAVTVYDHLASPELLKDTRLFFLTGITVSEETLSAVEARVREGASCISLPDLAPANVREDFNGEEMRVSLGDGEWIISPDFQGDLSLQVASRYRGKSDELRNIIADREIVFSPQNGDPDKMNIEVNDFANRACTFHGSRAFTSSEELGIPTRSLHAINGKLDDEGWISGEFSGEEWLAVDLGAPLSISRMVLHPGPGGRGFPIDFEIQTSSDGAEWCTEKGTTFKDYPRQNLVSEGKPQAQVLDFPEQRARFFRVRVTRTDGKHVRLSEMELGKALN